MKSRLKTVFVILLIILAVGCAEKPVTEGDIEDVPAAAPILPVLSEQEISIADYETRVEKDGRAEDYLFLADLYHQAGMIKKQRDALERCFRLNNDAESYERLQDIVVNAAEENSVVQQKMMLIHQYLTYAEGQTEAVNILADSGWFREMMPKLSEGRRNYYREDYDDESILIVQVGYDYETDNTPYSRIWYTALREWQIICLTQQGNMLQLLVTETDDGVFNGAFSSWLCLGGDSGMVYFDAGTFKNGVIVGDFSSGVYTSASAADPFELFSLRNEPDMLIYTGNFGEDGVTSLTPPRGIMDGWIAYAYNDIRPDDYLYYIAKDDEDTEAYVFDYRFMELSLYPEFTPYVPAPMKEPQGEVAVDLTEVKVRVYDSVLEWFDGSNWHYMGEMADYIIDDPFHARTVASEGEGIAGQDYWFLRRGMAVVPRARVSNTPPAPGYSPPGGGESQDYSPPGGGSQDYSPPPSSPSSGGNTGGNDGGSDGQDIEWTPDLF